MPLFTDRFFAHTDLGVFHLPLRQFYAEQLARGEQVLWSSELFTGFYVHAEGQLGAFHPLHQILYRLFPLLIAFNLEIVLTYLFAYAGMWAFLRSIGLSAPAGMLGGMAFAFSGTFLLRLGHPNALAVTAHVPWLLMAIDASLAVSPRRRAAGTTGLAALIGSQILLGYPQYVWISGLACAVYFAGASLRTGWRRRLALPPLAAGLGCLLGAIQLLPTLDLLAGSERTDVSRAFQLSLSLHPLNLLQLWSPYALPQRVHAAADEMYLHEFGVYTGAVATIALVWVAIRRRHLRPPHIGTFALVIAGIGLLLALGRWGLVYTWLTTLPIVGAFRAPARHLVLLHFALAILVALMFDDLLAAAGRDLYQRMRRWVRLPAILSALTLAVAGLWWFFEPTPSVRAYGPALVLGFGLVVIATVLVSDASRGIRAALLVLPLFHGVDLAAWGYSYALGSPPLTFEQFLATREPPPSAPPGTTVHDATGTAAGNVLLLRDLRVLNAYVGLYPKRRLPPDLPETWRIAGVEWIRSAEGWRRVPDPLPRTRVVPFARISGHPAADVQGLDVAAVALTSKPLPEPLAAPHEAEVDLLIDRPGRLELAVDTPRWTLLATTERYHQGWRANAGIRTVETLPVYGDYLGVLLQPGNYTVQIAFDPPSYRYGAMLTIWGIILTAAAALLMLADARSRERLSARLAEQTDDAQRAEPAGDSPDRRNQESP